MADNESYTPPVFVTASATEKGYANVHDPSTQTTVTVPANESSICAAIKDLNSRK